MNAKLFIVMGVSWILELTATVFCKQSVMWYFSDSFNIMQGVLVFFIFVFKWKVWHAIRHRFGFPVREGGSNSGGSNATTTTTAARLDRIAVHAGAPDYGKLISRTSGADGAGKDGSSLTLATSNANLSAARKVK